MFQADETIAAALASQLNTTLASTSLVEDMEHYDPLLVPDPAEWLAREEGQRIARVVDYHEGARGKLPNARLHAAIHVIVENQIAMGDELPVRRVLDRCRAKDLTGTKQFTQSVQPWRDIWAIC